MGAFPILWATVSTFSFDSFWWLRIARRTNCRVRRRTNYWSTGTDAGVGNCRRRLLRARVAPFGLLVWLLLGLIAMYLPVPYQRRLSFGIQPALAVLAGNGLVAAYTALTARRAAMLRLATVATAASGSVLVLVSVAASGFGNSPLPSTGRLPTWMPPPPG